MGAWRLRRSGAVRLALAGSRRPRQDRIRRLAPPFTTSRARPRLCRRRRVARVRPGFCEARMPDAWLFWGIAAAAVAACVGLVFAPLPAAPAGPSAGRAIDMQVHRDQLREIDADAGARPAERGRGGGDPHRGVAPPARRRRRRGRRGGGRRGAARGLSRRLAPALMAAFVLAALRALRLARARRGCPTSRWRRGWRRLRPNAPRARAGRGRGVAAAGAPPRREAGEEDARARRPARRRCSATRPDDLQGHRLLARSLAALGRWPEARAGAGARWWRSSASRRPRRTSSISPS